MVVEGWMRISWTDRVRNEEVLRRVKLKRNIVRELRRRKTNGIGHILRWNCLKGTLLNARSKGTYEEDVSSYWLTLRKREDTGN